ncbi:hypothetical protein MMC28_005231 [Mycoblastus sanguinarius]|nr:hypothetical protein [Mycoblastus sanguinarius]
MPSINFKVAVWITEILTIFGLNDPYFDESLIRFPIGWPSLALKSNASTEALVTCPRSIDECRNIAKEYYQGINIYRRKGLSTASKTDLDRAGSRIAQVHSHFEQDLKSLDGSESLAKSILPLTDTIRDVRLWSFSVNLEDRDGDDVALIRKAFKAEKRMEDDRKEQKQNGKQNVQRNEMAAAKAAKA